MGQTIQAEGKKPGESYDQAVDVRYVSAGSRAPRGLGWFQPKGWPRKKEDSHDEMESTRDLLFEDIRWNQL